MKKLLMLGALVLSLVSFSGSAFAAGYGDGGCGLGAIIFGSEQGGVQVLASTTNGSLSNQTFGITTGTSNCNPAGLVKLEKEREEFVEKNYHTFVKEMAMGEGENLNTLASMYGCSQESYGDFGTVAQENFSTIVKDQNTSSKDMLGSLEKQISGHAVLSKTCTGVIG